MRNPESRPTTRRYLIEVLPYLDIEGCGDNIDAFLKRGTISMVEHGGVTFLVMDEVDEMRCATTERRLPGPIPTSRPGEPSMNDNKRWKIIDAAAPEHRATLSRLWRMGVFENGAVMRRVTTHGPAVPKAEGRGTARLEALAREIHGSLWHSRTGAWHLLRKFGV